MPLIGKKKQSGKNSGFFKALDFTGLFSSFSSVYFWAQNPLVWILGSASLAKLPSAPFFLHIFQFHDV